MLSEDHAESGVGKAEEETPSNDHDANEEITDVQSEDNADSKDGPAEDSITEATETQGGMMYNRGMIFFVFSVSSLVKGMHTNIACILQGGQDRGREEVPIATTGEKENVQSEDITESENGQEGEKVTEEGILSWKM